MSIFEIVVIVCFVILWLTVIISAKDSKDETRPEMDGFKSLGEFEKDSLRYDNRRLARENSALQSERDYYKRKYEMDLMYKCHRTPEELLEELRNDTPKPEPKEFKVKGTLKVVSDDK